MFNLEQAMSKWQRRMRAAGIKDPNVLAELKSHLQEDFAALVAQGKTEAVAFDLAVARLGKPASVQTEFGKIQGRGNWMVTLGALLWMGAVVAMAGVFAWRTFAGKLNPLLAAHIFTITAGYGAVFLLGIFGLCSACGKRPPLLSRAVYLFSHLAAGLVVAGILLGLPVCEQHFGSYWRWNAKGIGGLCVAAWLAALVGRQRFGQTGNREIAILCVGGNIIVSLAWFGAGMMDYNLRTHARVNLWPLAIFVAINLGFLLVGLGRRSEAAET